jgi:anthranilate synthase/aminodeoxychorismate synthase-like glutamine amidotransferase
MKPNTIRILLADNEDSFTGNLVQLFEESGALVSVLHPSEITAHTISGYDGLIISPGPGLPHEMDGLANVVRLAAENVPILGVCLGHQAIAVHFGATLFRLEHIIHGRKLSIKITKNKSTLLQGLGNNAVVGLYHSWAVSHNGFPQCLTVTAMTDENTIMAFEHAHLPVFGVQFHPESYITEEGKIIAQNFLNVISLNKK